MRWTLLEKYGQKGKRDGRSEYAFSQLPVPDP